MDQVICRMKIHFHLPMWHSFSVDPFQHCFSFPCIVAFPFSFHLCFTSSAAKYYFWISQIFLNMSLPWPTRQCMCVCMIWSHVASGWPGGWLGGTCILGDQWQARRYAFSAGHLVAASWQLGKSNSTWCFSAAEGPNKWFFKLQETHGPPVVQACYKGWTFQQGKEVRSWKQSCQKPGRQRDFFLDMLNKCPRKHLLLS